MFGSSSGGSTFGGFGQTNSGNTQNQASTFGSFGTPATSGSTSFFGQPQSQQAQQTNSAVSNPFGGFGSSSTQNNNAFGGFNSTTPQQGNTNNSFGFGAQTNSPAFGANGGGLFGSSPASTGTVAFGSQPSSNPFGSATTNTGLTSFGGASNVFGAPQSQQGPLNGTANPPFSVFVEKEGTGTGINHFQSITCMPAYSTASFEELRVQDYAQNRRFGNASGAAAFNGGFGSNSQSNVFGGSQTQSSPFGQSSNPANSLFGQKNQSLGTNNGPFGSSLSNTASFGQPGAGVFGSNTGTTSTTNSGLFGGSSTGMFGSNNTSGNTGLGFGANNSAFGQTQSTPSLFSANSNSGGFGQNSGPSQKPFSFGAPTSTSFGQAANQQGGLFGTQSSNNVSSAPNPFGQASQTPPTTNTTNNLFGQQNSDNTAQSNSFSFGNNNNNNQQSVQSSGTGFSFGTNTASSATPKPFSFGAPAAPASTFGTNTTSSAQKPFSFGTPAQTNTASTTGLFGQNTSTPAATNTSMFGNNTSSMFGNNNSSTPASATPSTGLFGKTGGTSLFNNNPANSTSSGMFGANVAPQGTNNNFGGNAMFGNSQPANAGMFGQASQASQGNLQMSVASNAYGNNPLFASVHAPGTTLSGSASPIATPLVTNSIKKKPAMLPQFKISSRSPASASKVAGAKPSMTFGHAPSLASRKPGFVMFDEELLINPEAFSMKSNIKRLVIDRKISDQDLLSGSTDLKATQQAPPSVHSEVSHHLTNSSRSLARGSENPHHNVLREIPINGKATDNLATEAENLPASIKSEAHGANASKLLPGPNQGAYWTSPSLTDLLEYSKAELSKVPDLKIGRRGYGQISFNAPVDLSSLDRVEDIAGQIVVFEGKMCTVYPDEGLKPEEGRGLNQPATITLEHCYPLSKDKREPIRDPEHPRFQQHVDRLKRMAETEFVDYLADTGTWVFKVKHF